MSDLDAESDAIAEPLPLASGEPRSKLRFVISGYSGTWRLVRSLSDPASEPVDLTVVRSINNVLAFLGETIAEFERD